MPGDFIESFDFAPAETEWSTKIAGISGSSSKITDSATMDEAVQRLSADEINDPLPTTADVPPTFSAAAQYNSRGHFVQTDSEMAAASLLMATLRNFGDADARGLLASYELSAYSPVASAEEIPRHRLCYSMTGLPNSWNPVGNVAPSVNAPFPQRRSLEFAVGTWTNQADLFLLWVDDNATASQAAGETAYTIATTSTLRPFRFQSPALAHLPW